MSITWSIEIMNPQPDTLRADVTATRTDSENPTVPQVYTFPQASIGTAPDRTALLNTIKGEVEKAAAAAAARANLEPTLTSLAASGKNALEAWEATR